MSLDVPHEDLHDLFSKPPADRSPVPLWWWSGEPLDAGRLCWQMDRLIEGGIHNAVVINLAPTGPLYGSRSDDPVFQSDAWWEIFRGVCDHARRVGFRIWFYDQLGFSGANLQGHLVRDHPRFRGEVIERLTATGSCVLVPPSGARPIAAFELGVEPVEVPLVDGRLAYEGSGRVMLAYARPTGFNYFDPAACGALMDLVHGEFERRLGGYLGDVIVGSFQDELPHMPSWGPGFEDAFAHGRGYRIERHLAALWEDVPGAEQVRVDYQLTRGKLAEDAFFRPLNAWHAERDMVCGFDQQGLSRAGQPTACVRLYADYLRTHRWFGAPGSDHGGDTKPHSSLAHLYGHRHVWLEAFHSTGWGGSLEETFDWLLPYLRDGATLYDPHAVYYSTLGGWWEWAPPSTCWRQPYWRHYKLFADTVARLCAVLSSGVHRCDVAVVFPSTTVQAYTTLDGAQDRARRADDLYRRIVGTRDWPQTYPGVLDADGRDFDVVDDDSLVRGEVAEGAFRVSGETYRALVLPGCEVLEAETARVLVEFVEAGGTLVAVGAEPRLAAAGDQAAVERLRRLFGEGRAILVQEPDELPGTGLGGLARRVEAPVPTLLRQVGDRHVLFVPAVYPRATQVDAGSPGQFTYTFDPRRYLEAAEVTVADVGGPVYLWDPTTGRTRRLAHAIENGRVRVQIPFDDGPAALVVFGGDDVDEGPSPVTGGILEEIDLAESWSSAIEPTMDNRWGDLDMPPYDGHPPLAVWSMDHHRRPGYDVDDDGAPAAEWGPVRATFGTGGWTTGPCAPDSAPEPLSDVSAFRAGEDWHPVDWSPSRGIRGDRILRSQAQHGQKGFVPEEFLDLGALDAGQAVQFRTVLRAGREEDAYLAVGARTRRRVWWNGQEVTTDDDRYLTISPVHVRSGDNLLEIRMIADADSVTDAARLLGSPALGARGFYTLVRDPEAFARPEVLVPDDEPARGSTFTMTRSISLSSAPDEVTLHFGSDGPATLLVNDVVIARQGEFFPYENAPFPMVIRYEATSAFRAGLNEVRIEIHDPGRATGVFLDALARHADGTRTTIATMPGWAGERDGRPAPVRARLTPWYDPSWAHLWRRSHPLPEAEWLTGPATPSADYVNVETRPEAKEPAVEWFRVTVPPGTRSMELPVSGSVSVLLDGREIPCVEGKVFLPQTQRWACRAEIRVETGGGRSGGRLWHGPPIFETSEGSILLGDWCTQGLSGYSGAVRYVQEVELSEVDRGSWTLDLGHVRGTVEVSVNDRLAGTLLWSPYRIGVDDLIRVGRNKIELLVCNTLGPYLQEWTNTPYVLPGQTVSGILGPVRMLRVAAGERLEI